MYIRCPVCGSSDIVLDRLAYCPDCEEVFDPHTVGVVAEGGMQEVHANGDSGTFE